MRKFFVIILIFFVWQSTTAKNVQENNPNALESGQSIMRAQEFNPAMVDSSGLTKEQALEVLVMVLSHEKYHLNEPGVFVKTMDTDKKEPYVFGYYSFALALKKKPSDMPNILGTFSISALTGDVWETSQCERFDFSELKQVQSEIIQKTGKSMLDEKNARNQIRCPDPSEAASIHVPSDYYEIPTAKFNPDKVAVSGLTKQQAKQLLVVVLKHENYKLNMKGMSLEGPMYRAKETNEQSPPGYYSFGLNYDTPEAGATDVLGFYAVSIATGDVWERNTCKNFNFPELRQLQAQIMQKTGKSMADDKSVRHGLGCADE